MPSAPVPNHPLATQDDLRRLEHELAEVLVTLQRVLHDQEIQFTRIAQIQADIDLIRGAWSKVKPPEADQPYTGPERRRDPRATR